MTNAAGRVIATSPRARNPNLLQGLTRSSNRKDTLLDGNGWAVGYWNTVGAIKSFGGGFAGWNRTIARTAKLYVTPLPAPVLPATAHSRLSAPTCRASYRPQRN